MEILLLYPRLERSRKELLLFLARMEDALM
jgi:hypothetical protein